MKTFLLSISILFVVIFFYNNCGSSGGSGGASVSQSAGACASSTMLGSWKGVVGGQNDTLIFSANCTYTDTLCQGTGTYPNISAMSGVGIITITSTNSGPSCLPVGQTACSFSISGNSISYNCGGGATVFVKQ